MSDSAAGDVQAVTIEQAVPEDARAIGQLWLNLQRETALSDPRLEPTESAGAWYSDFVRAEIAASSSCLLLARREKQVIGFVVGQIHVRPTLTVRRIGAVLDLYVDPAHRNMGVGTRLYSSLTRWFGTAGVERVEVQTAVMSGSANRFWQRHGFSEILRTLTCTLRP